MQTKFTFFQSLKLIMLYVRLNYYKTISNYLSIYFIVFCKIKLISETLPKYRFIKKAQ